jgi:hypothetical protein
VRPSIHRACVLSSASQPSTIPLRPDLLTVVRAWSRMWRRRSDSLERSIAGLCSFRAAACTAAVMVPLLCPASVTAASGAAALVTKFPSANPTDLFASFVAEAGQSVRRPRALDSRCDVG